MSVSQNCSCDDRNESVLGSTWPIKTQNLQRVFVFFNHYDLLFHLINRLSPNELVPLELLPYKSLPPTLGRPAGSIKTSWVRSIICAYFHFAYSIILHCLASFFIHAFCLRELKCRNVFVECLRQRIDGFLHQDQNVRVTLATTYNSLRVSHKNILNSLQIQNCQLSVYPI